MHAFFNKERDVNDCRVLYFSFLNVLGSKGRMLNWLVCWHTGSWSVEVRLSRMERKYCTVLQGEFQHHKTRIVQCAKGIQELCAE